VRNQEDEGVGGWQCERHSAEAKALWRRAVVAHNAVHAHSVPVSLQQRLHRIASCAEGEAFLRFSGRAMRGAERARQGQQTKAAADNAHQAPPRHSPNFLCVFTGVGVVIVVVLA